MQSYLKEKAGGFLLVFVCFVVVVILRVPLRHEHHLSPERCLLGLCLATPPSSSIRVNPHTFPSLALLFKTERCFLLPKRKKGCGGGGGSQRFHLYVHMVDLKSGFFSTCVEL